MPMSRKIPGIMIHHHVSVGCICMISSLVLSVLNCQGLWCLMIITWGKLDLIINQLLTEDYIGNSFIISAFISYRIVICKCNSSYIMNIENCMLQVKFTKTGVCHGFVLWINWVMDLQNSVVISTGPGHSFPFPTLTKAMKPHSSIQHLWQKL